MCKIVVWLRVNIRLGLAAVVGIIRRLCVCGEVCCPYLRLQAEVLLQYSVRIKFAVSDYLICQAGENA